MKMRKKLRDMAGVYNTKNSKRIIKTKSEYRRFFEVICIRMSGWRGWLTNERE